MNPTHSSAIPAIMLLATFVIHAAWAQSDQVPPVVGEPPSKGCEPSEGLITIEEAMKIIEDTGKTMERIRASENRASSEESRALIGQVNRELMRLDLEGLELPDGLLLDEDELIEKALSVMTEDWPHLTREDLMDPPPVVEWDRGRALVTFPNREYGKETERPRLGVEPFRWKLLLHPTTGGVLMIELP